MYTDAKWDIFSGQSIVIDDVEYTSLTYQIVLLMFSGTECCLRIKLLNILKSMGHTKKVIFCWIPSHIGIHGNHRVDLIAKSALDMAPNKNSKIPYTDLKLKIKQILTKKWQQLSRGNTYNCTIGPTCCDVKKEVHRKRITQTRR